MDGRRNNGGHSTKGKAGRKPKDVEGKLIERLDAIIDKDEAIEIIKELSKKLDLLETLNQDKTKLEKEINELFKLKTQQIN